MYVCVCNILEQFEVHMPNANVCQMASGRFPAKSINEVTHIKIKPHRESNVIKDLRVTML